MFLYYLAKCLLLTYMILKLSSLRLKLLAEYEIEGNLPCIRKECVREERVTSAVVQKKVISWCHL